jgi:exonuclease III
MMHAKGNSNTCGSKDDSRTFTCTSYNILAKSLGTNTAPWIFTISDEWTEQLGQQQLNDIKATIKSTYIQHFHKNMSSEEDPRNYQNMRALWSIATLRSPSDIPAILAERIHFEREWTVSYINVTTGEQRQAKTMGGVLIELLGEETGRKLFEHVLATENSVFCWDVRGPRIFDRVTSSLQTESNEDLGVPDVIFLQEYDCDQIPALYNEGGAKETFHDAMSSKGYDGLFFAGANLVSGLALFWKRQVFVLDVDKKEGNEESSSEMNNSTVSLGGSIGTAVFNYDMLEHWHPVPDDDKDVENKEYTEYKEKDNDDEWGSLMPTMDRKNLAMARLCHVFSGNILWAVCHHGMTDSRDNARCTQYPGEVRSHELRTISKTVERHVEKNQRVVLMGDFNVDVGEVDVLHGRLQRRQITRSGGGAGEVVKTKRRKEDSVLCIDTGFQVEDSCFHWKKKGGGQTEVIRDAFLPVHGRRSHATVPVKMPTTKDQSRYEHATSHNNKRREFIDHCWYGESGLEVRGVSNTKLPWKMLPDEKEGSDHIPISVMFELV